MRRESNFLLRPIVAHNIFVQLSHGMCDVHNVWFVILLNVDEIMKFLAMIILCKFIYSHMFSRATKLHISCCFLLLHSDTCIWILRFPATRISRCDILETWTQTNICNCFVIATVYQRNWGSECWYRQPNTKQDFKYLALAYLGNRRGGGGKNFFRVSRTRKYVWSNFVMLLLGYFIVRSHFF